MFFPLKAPYTVSADIVKYNGDAFNRHPDPLYLLQKKHELDTIGHDLTATAEDALPLVHMMGRYCGLNNATDIRSIALACEEDLAILHKGNLVSICFCFPSGFVPARKLGESFLDCTCLWRMETTSGRPAKKWQASFQGMGPCSGGMSGRLHPCRV